MHIKTLSVENFRNYEKQSIELCPATNVFYGNNAQGKTNLLEAVYLFSHGRSHRAKSDSELIRFGEVMYNLMLEFCDNARDYKAQIRYLRDEKKQIKINNIPITKLSELMSYLNVVMFTPEDLGLIKGSPSVRRRFIDEAISQIYPKYLSNLISYHKTLAQKNSLLRDLKYKGKTSDAMLSVWNEQLSSYGAVVYKYRNEFLKKLDEFSKPIHSDITNESFFLHYCAGIKVNDENIKDSYYNALEQNQKREIEIGSALVGIQRDDFKILVDEKEAKIFASQGQQRTSVLTLKIAQTEFIKNERGEYPVLLLDDIMSELDVKRRAYLWERITDKQVLLTCTDTEIFKNTQNTRLFHIDGGKIID